MKVRLTTSRTGHSVRDNRVVGFWSQREGEEIEVSDAEGRALLERGQAIQVKDQHAHSRK